MVKNIALILLLGITVFSMFKYTSEVKERYRIQDSLIKAQDQITSLVQEKQNLLQDLKKERELKEKLEAKNTNLIDYLRASKNRITRFFQENANIQSKLEDVNNKLSILKAENKALIDSRKRLYVENQEYKLKLNSIEELKNLIRELKTKKQGVLNLEAEGNRGFLIKDGRSTVKIEVVPAQTKE